MSLEREEKVKTTEYKEKGIPLELEVEKKKRIIFIYFEVRRTGRERNIKMKLHQKECSAGIFCNKRSDIYEGINKNMIRNMKKNIDKLTTKERYEEELKDIS